MAIVPVQSGRKGAGSSRRDRHDKDGKGEPGMQWVIGLDLQKSSRWSGQGKQDAVCCRTSILATRMACVTMLRPPIHRIWYTSVVYSMNTATIRACRWGSNSNGLVLRSKGAEVAPQTIVHTVHTKTSTNATAGCSFNGAAQQCVVDTLADFC